MPVNRAVFLDKDGTLIQNIPYNIDPNKIKLESGVIEGLRLLVNRGYQLVVVTNQSGIAKGYFSEEEVFQVRDTLQQILYREGLPLFKDFYFCPHHPDGIIPRFSYPCTCRKPLPGLLKHAARDHGLSLKDSWMIGDILDDIAAGNSAGCRSILIDNGNETRWEKGAHRTPYAIVSGFLAATNVIISSDKQLDDEYSNFRINTSI